MFKEKKNYRFWELRFFKTYISKKPEIRQKADWLNLTSTNWYDYWINQFHKLAGTRRCLQNKAKPDNSLSGDQKIVKEKKKEIFLSTTNHTSRANVSYFDAGDQNVTAVGIVPPYASKKYSLTVLAQLQWLIVKSKQKIPFFDHRFCRIQTFHCCITAMLANRRPQRRRRQRQQRHRRKFGRPLSFDKHRVNRRQFFPARWSLKATFNKKSVSS